MSADILLLEIFSPIFDATAPGLFAISETVFPKFIALFDRDCPKDGAAGPTSPGAPYTGVP